MKFVCEVTTLSSFYNGRISFAIDYGNVTGGFLNSLNFDIFGQEIRWCLKIIEIKLYDTIVVGESVQQLLHTYHHHNPDSTSIRYIQKSIESPWRLENFINLICIDNVNDFIEVDYIKRFIEKAFSSREALKIPQKRGKSEFNWWDLQDMIEERSYKELSDQKSKINLYRDDIGNTEIDPDFWEQKNLGPSLTQEIGQELMLPVEERFQVDLDDRILASYTGNTCVIY